MSLIVGSIPTASLPSGLAQSAAFVKYVDGQESEQVGASVKINQADDERVLQDAVQEIRAGRVVDLDHLLQQRGSPRADTITISRNAKQGKAAPRIVSQALENHLKSGRSQEIDRECRIFVDAYIKSIESQYKSAQDTSCLNVKDVDQVAKQTAMDYLELLRQAQQN